MKKILVLFTFFIFMLPVKTYAATDYEQQIENIASEYNISVEDITDADIKSVIDYLIQEIKSESDRQIILTVKLTAIIILISLVRVFSEKNNAAMQVMDNLAVLLVFVNLITPVRNVLAFVTEKLQSVKNFMAVFLPVFAGISMGSGDFFTSTIYSGFFLTGMVFVSNLILTYIMPSIQVYFSMIIADALSPFIKLKSISEFYIKSVKWLMKSIVSVICFVLTLQTTISRGKDTLAVKAGKLVSGAAIPVIGSALQDAIGSVYASMEAVKGYAGAVGIAGIVGIFLPSIVSLAVYWLCINCLQIAGDIFEVKSVSICIKGFITVIELVMSIVFLYMVMLLFSVTIMISLTNGV